MIFINSQKEPLEVLYKHLTPTPLFLIKCSIVSDDHSGDFSCMHERLYCEIPWHHTEGCRIGICDHARVSLDIGGDHFSCTFSGFWVDEVMMISPFSLGACTTCEKVIFECDRTNNFIRSEGVLKSRFPPSLSIEISSEIDEVSFRIRQSCLYHGMNDIDKVPLPHASELEEYVSVEDDFISYDFYITVISVSFGIHHSLFIIRHFFPISELSEPLSYCRVEISIGFPCNLKHIGEHSLCIDIEHCTPFSVQVVEPVSLEKSGKSSLKKSQPLPESTRELSSISIRIKQEIQVCPDDIKAILLHKETLVKIVKNAIKKIPLSRDFRIKD